MGDIIVIGITEYELNHLSAINKIDAPIIIIDDLDKAFDKLEKVNPTDKLLREIEKSLAEMKELTRFECSIDDNFRHESKSGWFNPKKINIIKRIYIRKFFHLVRKQFNKPKFYWRVKKSKKLR